MDKSINSLKSEIAGFKVKETVGHRVRYVPHKTTWGGRIICSCGWSTRAGGSDCNRAGLAYAKAAAIEKFNRHAVKFG